MSLAFWKCHRNRAIVLSVMTAAEFFFWHNFFFNTVKVLQGGKKLSKLGIKSCMYETTVSYSTTYRDSKDT